MNNLFIKSCCGKSMEEHILLKNFALMAYI